MAARADHTPVATRSRTTRRRSTRCSAAPAASARHDERRSPSGCGVTPASASAMVKKLAERGLVDPRALPRRAAHAPTGERVALEVLRHHRLLELYLAEHLGVPWDRVHEEAEALEHVISEDLEARIAAKLGNPTHDPHGDPIPDARPRDRRGRDAQRSADLAARRARALRARLGLRPGDAALPRRARRSRSATRSRCSTRQPFGGPLTVRFGDAEHVLGGGARRARCASSSTADAGARARLTVAESFRRKERSRTWRSSLCPLLA